MPIQIFDHNVDAQPSATDFNRYFMQQHSVIKPSDESVTNSTTLQDDDALFAPVDANTDYWVWCIIFYTGPSTNGDLKINWDGPSGATFTWVSDSLGSAATTTVGNLSRNDQDLSTSPAPATVAVDCVAPVKGLLRIGGTAGTFKLTWAQATASATPCTIYAQSTLILRRLTS